MADFFFSKFEFLVNELNHLREILLEFFSEHGIFESINQTLRGHSNSVSYLLNSNLELNLRLLYLENSVNSLTTRLEAVERELEILKENSSRLKDNVSSNLVGFQEKLDNLD